MKKSYLSAFLLAVLSSHSSATTIAGPGDLFWDISNQYGYVLDGGDDAFDAFGISVVGSSLVNNFNLTYDGGLTHTGTGVLGSTSIDRSVVVDASRLYATYVDTFTNNSTEALSTTVWWGGNVGSDTVVRATSSGSGFISSSEAWVVTSDSDIDSPVVALAFAPGADHFTQTYPHNSFFGEGVMAMGWDISLLAGESFSMTNILWRGDSSGGQAEVDAAIAGIRDLALFSLPPSQSVPAPATLALLGFGLLGLACTRRRLF